MSNFLKRLELPPLWLLLCMFVAFWLSQEFPIYSFAHAAAHWVGRGLVLIGLLVMAWSAMQFIRKRTSIIPRETATTLVTSGPYQFTRNPIYLGDLLILLGWCVSLGAVSTFVTAPAFVMLINKRFIAGEEAMLKQTFPDEYAAWAAKVRRWI